MSEIQAIFASEILDSRGFPTVEAEVVLVSGHRGQAAVPSGASTGSKEAVELRDKDPSRFMGKGVMNAVNNITQVIAPALQHQNSFEQKKIDNMLIALDGTLNKQNLGANALLAVSLACARAAANAKSLPLYTYISQLIDSPLLMPVPMFNILNGGAHADNSVDIQEFMVLPSGAPNFPESVRYGVEIYHSLKSVLKAKGLNTNVGDEGGFAPDLSSNEAAIEIIMQAIDKTGLRAGSDVHLGLDVAASEFYKEEKYLLSSEKKSLTSTQWAEELAKWVKNYPIISIEDPMDENDWEGWGTISTLLGSTIQLVGDDVFVTNTKIFQEGIHAKIANAILIKPNQIGTLTETFDAIMLAKKANYNVIISHRSGETTDTFIADLAVGCAAGQIKTGAPCRSERTAKYNQLLRIATQSQATFAGKYIFKRWSPA